MRSSPVQVFPVFVNTLPLRQDWQENPIVYRTLCHLMMHVPDKLMPHMATVLKLCAYALKAPENEVSAEVKAGIAPVLKQLLQGNEAVQQHASQMSAEDQAVLRQLL